MNELAEGASFWSNFSRSWQEQSERDWEPSQTQTLHVWHIVAYLPACSSLFSSAGICEALNISFYRTINLLAFRPKSDVDIMSKLS